MLLGLGSEEGSRVSLLSPEDIPDYLIEIGTAQRPNKNVVRGYRVSVNLTAQSAKDSSVRRQAIARAVGRSLQRSAGGG